MRVTVLYFAHARSVRGLAREELDVPAGMTVGELQQELGTRLGPAVRRFHLARNEAYARESELLEEGDELAVIPPVSGGARLVGAEPVDVDGLIAAVRGPEHGAICVFLGTVRNEFRGRPTAKLHYEAYADMAERELQKLALEVEQQHGGCRVALYHRTGTLELTEASVGVAVAAPHRAEAFDGCRRVIEEIKQRVPIWKREIAPGGEEVWHDE